MKGEPGVPVAVDRATFQAKLDRLRDREKAHTREGDAIAAARRRLPMVEVDAYFMWNPGRPAPEQCEGCTWITTQVTELSYLHSRDITYTVFCQGPYDESARWPQQCSITRTDGGPPAWPPVSAWPGGRPIAQWSRLEAGRSDDLAVGS